MSQKEEDRYLLQQKISQQKQEEMMEMEHQHKQKMILKHQIMKDLEDKRRTQEMKKIREKQNDAYFAQEQERVLLQRDEERNQLFNRIKNNGINVNMRQGYTNDPAGIAPLKDIDRPGNRPEDYQPGPGMIFGELEGETYNDKVNVK